MVTRDRASAYAKVIEQELPGAMQIADRFHIHQNLLQVIKKALYKGMPSSIKIQNHIAALNNLNFNKPVKKNPKSCG
ncbi:transposase [Clostridium sp. ZS1]|uniref:transposase n=1 Tax=Clostridium sp. ZS1 TaxID=2949989 RepID=UPI00207AFAA3